MNARAGHFPLMDSIRGIAVLAVLCAHGGFFLSLSGNDWFRRLQFAWAVPLFFITSAFLLYRPFARSHLRREVSPSVRAFAWRRFLRIVPPYWVALTIIVIWVPFLGRGVFTATGIPTYYGLAQIYRPGTALAGLPQAWTLGAEVAFYVLLPLYAWAVRRGEPTIGRQLRCAAALFSFSIAYQLAVVASGAIGDHDLVALQINVIPYLDAFSIGIALASISVWLEGRDELPRALRVIDRRPWLPWLAAAVAFAVCSTALGFSGQLGENISGPQYFARHQLLTVIALGLFLPAPFGEVTRGWVRRVLASRFLLYVGLVSYSFYLYHFAVFIQLENWGFTSFAQRTTPLLWLPATVGGALILATASYYLIERPALSLKRLVPERRRAQQGEAIAEPAPVAPTTVP